MPVELAKEILDKEFSKPGEFERYQVDLAGGEPFLCMENIKEIVKYVVDNSPRWKKNIYFYLGTNITLLNPAIKKWLLENKDYVMIGTSLDGIKDVHDKNR